MIATDLKKIYDIKAGVKSALRYIGKTPGNVFAEYPDMIEKTTGGNLEDSMFAQYFKPIKTIIKEGDQFIMYNAIQCIYDKKGEHLIIGDYIGPVNWEVNLNDEWRLSETIPNPDPTLYAGVYESFSNHNVSNGIATMYITVYGLPEFRILVRSAGEGNYDYLRVYAPNSDTQMFTTSGNQNTETDINAYTEVIINKPEDSEEYTIKIDYRKDGSVNNEPDAGYVLIPIN